MPAGRSKRTSSRSWFVVALTLLAALLDAGCVRAPSMPAMPPYAATELQRRIKESRWAKDPAMTDEPKAIIRGSIAHYRRFAESLPPDAAGEATIKEVARYFDGDVIRIWMNCHDAYQFTPPEPFVQSIRIIG